MQRPGGRTVPLLVSLVCLAMTEALLLALAVVALAALAGLAVWPRDEPVGISGAVIGAALGLLGFSLADLASRLLSFPPELGPILIALLGAVVALWRLDAGRLTLWRDDPSPQGRARSLLLAAIFLGPVVAAGLRMGTGPWPAMFFNVDTAHYMTQVQALLRFDDMPPPSLNNLGYRVPYHYGVQTAVAAISRLSGLAPHTSAFLLLMPLLAAAIAAVAWRFAEQAARANPALSHPLLYALLLFPLVLFKGGLIRRIATWAHPDPAVFAERLFQGLFTGIYPMMSQLAGMFVTYMVLHALLWWPPRRAAAIAALLVGTVTWFKPAYLIPLGGAFGAAALWRTYRERSLRPLLAPALALLAALLLRGLAYPQGRVSLVVGLAAFEENDKLLAGVLELVLIYGIVAFLVARLSLRSIPWAPFLGLGVSFLLSAFLAVGHTDLEGRLVLTKDFAQTLHPTPVILAGMLVFALARGWGQNPGAAARRLRIAAVVLVALPLLRHLLDVATIAVAPQRWHEYADNRAIGAALAHIPVDSAVVASNDLRYPADGYARHHLQAQMAALFGHQAYSANLRYEMPPDARRRAEAQARLAGGSWGPEIERIAWREGWTHLLIHRRAPHVADIDLPLVYENEAYAVYAVR